MKRLLMAGLVALSLLAVPASVTRAAGPPQPDCIPNGNQCLLLHNASYNDGNVTLNVNWSVDIYSGNIESVSGTIPSLPSGAIDCRYTVSPAPPNAGPIFVSYDYTLANGSSNRIGMYVYSTGASYNYSASGVPSCYG